MSANLAGREYFCTSSSFTTHGQMAVDPGLCEQDLMNSLTSSFEGVLFNLLKHANKILYCNAKTKIVCKMKCTKSGHNCAISR